MIRWASLGMSKAFPRSVSSSGVSRSSRRVPRPASCRTDATYWLRSLFRPLPLPWAKTTTGALTCGRTKWPSSVTCAAGMWASVESGGCSGCPGASGVGWAMMCTSPGRRLSVEGVTGSGVRCGQSLSRPA
ncbi:hypothetical protein ACFFX0_09745 [Citricoccus parietis]|uniref:Uncharacterized protein n=1 Tax=Citricoccus parietis TaxID=592307 RepID=A0ABV5FXQ2_9MICC